MNLVRREKGISNIVGKELGGWRRDEKKVFKSQQNSMLVQIMQGKEKMDTLRPQKNSLQVMEDRAGEIGRYRSELEGAMFNKLTDYGEEKMKQR